MSLDKKIFFPEDKKPLKHATRKLFKSLHLCWDSWQILNKSMEEKLELKFSANLSLIQYTQI